MRGHGTNPQEKAGLKRILCASQFTISDMAGISPDPACNHTDMRSSQLNQASHTPDDSYLLVFSTLLSSLSPISFFLVHNSTIIVEYEVESSHSISPFNDYQSTWSTTIHLVQAYTESRHTPSTMTHPVQPFTEYDYTPGITIHGVQAYTECSIRPRMFVFPLFSWLVVDPWMYL